MSYYHCWEITDVFFIQSHQQFEKQNNNEGKKKSHFHIDKCPYGEVVEYEAQIYLLNESQNQLTQVNPIPIPTPFHLQE